LITTGNSTSRRISAAYTPPHGASFQSSHTLLILPWVQVEHLASHILGRMAKQLPRDWQGMYAHPVYLLETFVDPERYRGTCYRAANWVVLGRTTGRGKNDRTNQVNRSIKEVLALPLHRRFRELLQEGR
jgi:hypothetical protein